MSNIYKSYGDNEIFKNFSFEFKSARVTCLLGESGSGKTTLLNIISGITEYSGKVDGAEGNISYIFQSPRLIPSLTVYGNLDYVLHAVIQDKVKRKELIMNVLNIVELGEAKDKYPRELSGGMAQRLAMARAFAYPSSLLIMDEPFKALDIGLKKRLTEAFLTLWEKDKRTVIYVTHDIDEALLISDRIAVIKGKPASLVYNKEIELSKRNRDLAGPELTKVRSEIYIHF
jgi:NitT/TauT family transport system ATP-binding protein